MDEIGGGARLRVGLAAAAGGGAGATPTAHKAYDVPEPNNGT